jgi:twitching motility two-component system response regulator PilH
MARVLIVDDAQEAIDFMAGVLRAAGHQVITSRDGHGLEQTIERERPDLVLLDIVLPERNGFQVLRSLRRSEGTHELPVILVSSKSEPTDVEWGMMQGASDYLTKPFSPERLLGAVGQHA